MLIANGKLCFVWRHMFMSFMFLRDKTMTQSLRRVYRDHRDAQRRKRLFGKFNLETIGPKLKFIFMLVGVAIFVAAYFIGGQNTQNSFGDSANRIGDAMSGK